MAKRPSYQSPTCWAPGPAKAVVLEKIKDLHGSLPIGETFRWDYKITSDTEARARARAALVRDHPNEDPMDWKVVS